MKRMVINLPIAAEPVPDEEQISATICDVRQWVADARENAIGYALRIGLELLRLRELCERTGAKFGDFFPKNDAERDDPAKLPFMWRTGQMLMSIAENTAIQDAKHASHVLPADWTSLYKLSRVPAPKLSRLIEQKAVRADISRGEADRLAKAHTATGKAGGVAKTLADGPGMEAATVVRPDQVQREPVEIDEDDESEPIGKMVADVERAAELFHCFRPAAVVNPTNAAAARDLAGRIEGLVRVAELLREDLLYESERARANKRPRRGGAA